jgi:hypothetical protein
MFGREILMKEGNQGAKKGQLNGVPPSGLGRGARETDGQKIPTGGPSSNSRESGGTTTVTENEQTDGKAH